MQVSQVRYFTCEALGKLGDVRAVEPLMEALKDEGDQVRYQAANALVVFGGQLVLMGLKQACEREEENWLQEVFSDIVNKLEKKIKVKEAIEEILLKVED